MSFMDEPPADYGSDRYDYIEIQSPGGERPPQWLLDSSLEACSDCRPNVFLRLANNGWHRTIAHDESCPTLAAIEKSPPS